MCYRWLYITLMTFGCFSALAQHPLDSLQQEYDRAMQEKNHVRAGIYLSAIGSHYYNASRLDTALQLYYRALETNRFAKNDSMIGYDLNVIAAIHLSWGNFDSALNYYEESIQAFSNMGDSTKVATLQVNLGKILQNKGLYDQAIEKLFAAMRILEGMPPDYALSSCYTTIAIVYKWDEKYAQSLYYHHKALNVRTRIVHSVGIAGSLNNIGAVFSDVGNYDSALYYFEKSLTIKRTLNDRKSIASTLHNLGEVKFAQGQYDQAKTLYTESLELKRQSTDKVGQVMSLIGLAECDLLLKSYGKAYQYLNEASALEQSIGGLLEQRKRLLELYVKISRATGNYNEASDYAEMLMLVKDSLSNKDKERVILQTQARYDVERRDQEITILHTEKELIQTADRAKSYWIIALIIAITLTLVIAVLIYTNFRVARSGRKKVEVLLKELNHRVKNNLQILSSVLSLQSQHLTDEQALLSVKQTESRINAMALIHRKLYSDENNTIVSTRGYFRELIEFLVSSYGFQEEGLKLTMNIDEVEVDVDKAIPLGLIANELISNAFKYAYSNKKNPELTIKLTQHENLLNLIIQDNGIGWVPQESTEETRFGMRMVNILIRDLKGTFQTHATNGTLHSVTIPLT